MIISIGILAWNEAECIGGTIRSLLEQSLIQTLQSSNDWRVEVIVVPNGCTDDTAAQAVATLDPGAQSLPDGVLTWRVESVAEPGKVNAWNLFVHRFSHPQADYVFLMDADIRLGHPDTLQNMVNALEQNAHASVAVDVPRKHIAAKKWKSLADRISLAISGITQAAPGQLTGQLYCARGPLLRCVHMPLGLLVEDGFLKQMLCTDLLRQPCDNSRVICAPDATHVFEAYTGLNDIFLNQRRQQIGHAVYTYLRDYLRERVGEKNAGEIIAENNARDPDWFRALIQERMRQSGLWVMYPGAFSVRWRRLRNLSTRQALVRVPIAMAAFLLDIPVLIAANHRLKTGQLAGVWKDTKSTALDQRTTPSPSVSGQITE
jgi:glycosyltransferase involved in cell wall biosynthesis